MRVPNKADRPQGGPTEGLVRASSSGDKEALNQLLVSCNKRIDDLAKKAARRCGLVRLSSDVAKDVAQRARLKISEALQRANFEWRSAGEFEGWLARVVLTAALDHKKHATSKRRDFRCEDSYVEDAFDGVGEPEVRVPFAPTTAGNLRQPDAAVHARIEMKKLQKKMPNREFRIFELIASGHTYSEIGLESKSTEDAIRQAAKRGTKKAKDY